MSIRVLEASVGVELLDRSGPHLQPTDHGRALAEHAAAISAEVRTFEARLSEGAARRGRRLLDLAVCLDIERHHSPALVREALCHDEYAVFAGARNPLGRRDDLEAADLADRPWLLGRNLGDVAAAWQAAWDRARRPPPVPTIETTSLEFCRQALATGPYLTVLPRGLVADDVAARRLQVIPVAEFAWERPIARYVRRTSLRKPGLRAIINALRTAARAWET